MGLHINFGSLINRCSNTYTKQNQPMCTQTCATVTGGHFKHTRNSLPCLYLPVFSSYGRPYITSRCKYKKIQNNQ